MTIDTHLAVGQFPAAIGRPGDNLDCIARLSARAAKEGAEFILFPEDCLTGYPAKANSAFDVAIVESGDELARLLKISRDNHIAIAAGFIERMAEHCHSSHFVTWPDARHTIIRKYSVDARDRTIGITPAAAQEDKLIIAGANAAMAICMDGTDDFFAAAQRKGARIVLHPSGGACATSAHATDPNADKIDAAERQGCAQCVSAARERAKRLNAIYLVANPVGFDGQRGYPGNSFIISADGEVLALLEGTAIIEKMTEAVAVAPVRLA